MIVSVNPITKQPTAFEANVQSDQYIFEGQYQNVAEVSEDWVIAERKRLGDRILENYELWSKYGPDLRKAIEEEREECIQILLQILPLMRSNTGDAYSSHDVEAYLELAARAIRQRGK